MSLAPRLHDRLLVEEFHADYVACLNELRLEEWPDFFVENGQYGLWARENWDAGLPAPMFLCRNRRQMKDRVTAYREANIYPDHWNRHLISATRIVESSEDAIVAASNYAVLQTRQDGESFVYQAGRCYDRFQREIDRLLLRERTIVYDTLAVRTLFVLPV
ncbi:aromatic-ring-hydroxylating dioxygenase subunit beta [Sphingopyxis sp.]|uniref:aromatic-ring-hydroxylating dioxygenase subunit beta n=1 Tax=Sphingopyxis sp. TaxID=1908224 RepID=UPI002FC8220A